MQISNPVPGVAVATAHPHVRRKLPWYLQFLNVLFLWIVYRDESVRKIRRNARIDD